MADDGLLAQLTRYAEAAGAGVSTAADTRAVATLLTGSRSTPLRCTAEVRARYPQLWHLLTVEGRFPVIAEELAAEEPDRPALAARLAGGTGLVLARAGVAETGSVLLADQALAPRLLSMLADLCVVLLPAAAIVPGLDQAAALLRDLERAGHRYCSLVTGPSRTADIERVLTIGVQGPQALHIIVLQDEGA